MLPFMTFNGTGPQQLFQEGWGGGYKGACTYCVFRLSRVRQRQGAGSPACGPEELCGCDWVWKQVMVSGERHVGSCDHFTCYKTKVVTVSAMYRYKSKTHQVKSLRKKKKEVHLQTTVREGRWPQSLQRGCSDILHKHFPAKQKQRCELVISGRCVNKLSLHSSQKSSQIW